MIDAVVPKDPKNPNLGHHRIKAYCGKPITFSMAENRKVCPDCDKQPPVGWVKPRVISASDTVLSVKEMEQCGLNPDGTRIDGKEPVTVKPTVTIETETAVEAKVEVKKDEVVLHIPLVALETQGDIAAFLIREVIANFGGLKTETYAEAKRLMKLEEKLEGILQV